MSELERCVAERDRPIIIHGLIRNYGVRILEPLEALLGVLVRDERGAGVLEGFAAGDMVIVVMTVNDVPDRLVRDLLDLVDISCHRLRTPVTDGIGRDHAC